VKILRKIKEYWYVLFLGTLLMSGLNSWLRGLDFSYGSMACAIPILGSWLLVYTMGIVMIIGICEMDDDHNETKAEIERWRKHSN